MRIRSILNHSFQAVLEGALVALIVIGLVAGTALAARGGGKTSGGSGSLALVMLNDANGDGSPNYGDDITFDVTASVTHPLVGVRCWQGSNFVYDAYVGYWSTYNWDRFFRLSSDYWDPDSSATCTARLFYNDSRGREHVLKTMDFGVAG